MNREWVETQKKKYDIAIKEVEDDIISFVNNSPFYKECDRQKIITELNQSTKDYYNGRRFTIYTLCSYATCETVTEMHELHKSAKKLNLERFNSLLYMRMEYLDKLLDGEPMYFDNGIVITDPCYITKEKNVDEVKEDEPKKESFMRYPHIKDYPDAQFLGDDNETEIDGLYISDMYMDDVMKFEKAANEYESHRNDWVKSEYGSNFAAIGIPTNISRDTIFGDWSCTVFKTDSDFLLSEVPIGEFCADAGMVIVADYNEVFAYNPDFQDNIDKCPWCVTVLKDFQGMVHFRVVEDVINYDEDDEYHKKGDVEYVYSVEVVGEGINKSNGERFNFISRQTGF